MPVVRRSGAYMALMLLLSAMLSAGSAVAQTLVSTEPEMRMEGAPRQAILVDLNADRNLDLVVAEARGALKVMPGDGKGGLTAANTLAEGVVSVASGHFVGDSSADLAVIAHDGGGSAALFLYQNYGTQGLGERVSVPIQGTLDDTCRLTSGDFDGDGYSDIAIFCASRPSQLTIGYGTGLAKFVLGSVAVGESRKVRSVGAFDLDHDGMADLAILSEGPDGQRDVRVMWGVDTRRPQVSIPIYQGLADEVLAGSLDGNLGSIIARSGNVLTYLNAAARGRVFAESGTLSLSGECSIQGAVIGPMRRTSSDASVLASDVVIASDCGNSGSLAFWRNSGATSIRIVPLDRKQGETQAFGIHVTSLSGAADPSGSVRVWLDKKSARTLKVTEGRAIFRTRLTSGTHSVYAAFTSDAPGEASSSLKIVLVGSGTDPVKYKDSTKSGGLSNALFTRDLQPRLLLVGSTPITLMGTSISPGTSVAAGTTMSFSASYRSNDPYVFSCGSSSPPATCSGGNQPPTGAAKFMVDSVNDSGSITLGGSTASVSCGQDYQGTTYYCSSNTTTPTATLVLPSGTHTVTMQWIGSGPDASSGVTTWSVTVAPPASPSMAVSCSPNPLNYGASTTCSSSLSGGNSPTGSEAWTINGGAWTTSGINGSEAGFNLSAPGTYTVGVRYSGDSRNNPASASTTLTISKVTPSISISCSPNPLTYSLSTTCTSHVTGGFNPTGSEAWAINGGAWITTGLNASPSGFNLSSPGSYALGVRYSGDGSNNAVSASTTITIVKATPGISVSCSSSTCTASVAANGSSANVVFTYNGQPWTAVALNSNSATATGFPSTTPGSYTVQASYAGDTNYNAVNAATAVTVPGPTPVVMEISASPTSLTVGTPLALQSLIDTGGSHGATGSVTFSSGGTSIGTATLSTVSATNYSPSTILGANGDLHNASYTAGSQIAPDGTSTAETINVSAIGAGSNAYAGQLTTATPTAGAPYTFSIWLKAPSPTFAFLDMVDTCNSNGGAIGFNVGTSWQRYSFTEPTAAACSGQFYIRLILNGPLPASTIYAWGAQLEQAAQPGPFVATSGAAATGTGAVATLTTSELPVGTDSITVSYVGDANNQAGTGGPVIVQVAKASPTIALTSSVNPSVSGTLVTFTATLSSGDSPSGTVTFLDGPTTLGTGTVSGGIATYATNSLSVGTHSITASYGGDANNNSVTSSVLSQVVNKGTPTLSVSSSENPSKYGDSVTFTASLPANATGTVTFLDGAATIGSAILTGGSATFTKSGFSVGTHLITASYAGDANYNASTSSVLSQVVNKAALTMTVTSSLNPSKYNQSIILTLAANGGGAMPTGTVSVMDGETSLGTLTLTPAGTAAITTSTLSAGIHTFTFTYNGDGNYY